MAHRLLEAGVVAFGLVALDFGEPGEAELGARGDKELLAVAKCLRLIL
jgi:hypothetical protein